MADMRNFMAPPTGQDPSGDPGGGHATINLRPGRQSQGRPDILRDMCADVSTAAPTMFRDTVVRELESVLIGSMKPNALLVGDAGVGKTRVVEELARRIASKDPRVPARLREATIYELPVASLMAGTAYTGSLEKRLVGIIEWCEDPKNDAIVFIDEIHQLMDARDGQQAKVAQILKPALARGRMRIIGATTTQESRTFMNDPAFSRRFTQLVVDELTPAQTEEVIRSVMPSLVMHYDSKVAVPDVLVPNIVATADETMVTHRPDNALTLLDRVMAEGAMERSEQEASTDPVMRKFVSMTPSLSVSESTVRSVAERIARGVASDLSFDRDRLTAALAPVEDQDEHVAEVVDAIERRSRHLFPDERPLSFLLAGPSGVGKSMCARIVARELMGTEPITLNMTEYSSRMSITRLLGSAPGYVGSDSMREKPLDPLMTNPYQVIILDELEKACPDVQRVFMEALDTGRIRDNQGRVIDMSKAVVFATTNAGCDRAASHAMGFVSQAGSRSSLVDVLAEWFDVALVNRFGHLIRFDAISRDAYRSIVAHDYEREAERVLREHSSARIPSELPDDELDAIVDETYVAKLGARPAGRAVRDWIEGHA